MMIRVKAKEMLIMSIPASKDEFLVSSNDLDKSCFGAHLTENENFPSGYLRERWIESLVSVLLKIILSNFY